MIIIKKTSDKDSVYTQTFTFYIGAIIISIIFYFIIGDGQYNVFGSSSFINLYLGNGLLILILIFY